MDVVQLQLGCEHVDHGHVKLMVIIADHRPRHVVGFVRSLGGIIRR